MSLHSVPIGIAKKFFSLMGLELYIARKRKNAEYCLIEKNSVEAIYNIDELMESYFSGLRLAGMESTDNFFKQCRLYLLQQLLMHVMQRGLKGDIAECGCWKGHSSYLISKILKQNNFSGSFSIFDSFEGGLSDKVEQDTNPRQLLSKKEIEREKNIFSSAEDDLHKVLKPFDFYNLYKGWIPDRFNEIEEKIFSFVHIDVDLYKPTLDSLEFFYPRLVDGGVIVVDDYGYTQFPGAKKAVDEHIAKNNYTFFSAALTGGCFIIK